MPSAQAVKGFAEATLEVRVLEYWIADPIDRLSEFLVLRDDQYVVVLPEGPIYRSPVFPEIQLDLEAFWREVDDELALT